MVGWVRTEQLGIGLSEPGIAGTLVAVVALTVGAWTVVVSRTVAETGKASCSDALVHGRFRNRRGR